VPPRESDRERDKDERDEKKRPQRVGRIVDGSWIASRQAAMTQVTRIHRYAEGML